MWYRFSKPFWRYDIIDGIDETYAYVNAASKQEAIEKLNNNPRSGRRYSIRTCDIIDEVATIPMEDITKVVH